MPLEPVFHDPEKTASSRAALAALADHRSALTAPGLMFGHATPAKPAGGGVIEMGYFTLGPEAVGFTRDVYAYGWVRDCDWMGWSRTPEGQRMLHDPAGLDDADEEDLARVLTVCMREAHWGPGALDHRFRDGLLTRVVDRATVLLSACN